MNTLVRNLALMFLGVALGVALANWWPGEDSVEREIAGEQAPLYWVAPMDPGYRRDGPGKSPMGMDLVPVYKDEQQTQGSEVVIPQCLGQGQGL